MVDHPKILLVDCGSEVREILDKVAESSDGTVENVSDGGTALERIRNAEFDIVVAGLSSPGEDGPGVDGLDLLRKLRALRPALKVLLIASEPKPDDVMQSIRERAYSYFSRPLTEQAMGDIVASAMRNPDWADGIELVSATRDWFTFRVRCQAENADRLLQFLREMKSGIPARERDDVITALRELLMNAIEHGGRSDPSQKIYINYVQSARAMIYHIQDPGSGFSFEDLPHAAVSYSDGSPIEHAAVRDQLGIRPGGFGILMTRKLVDELIYNEKGNEVLMIKYLACAPDEPAARDGANQD